MVGGRENLNFTLEMARESMDHQPFVEHDHVGTITPRTTDASNISTDVSTSDAANTENWSRAPQCPRSRPWNNPCSWTTFHFCSTSIQLILLVVVLSVFRDEHPHMALRVWAIGYGVGCLAMLSLLYCSYKWRRSRELQSNRLPQVSPCSEVAGESQTSARRQRFGKILKWLRRLLEGFFVLWFGVGTGIVDMRSKSRQAPYLNSCAIRVNSPRGAQANVILALPTYTFHACETNQVSEEDDVRISIDGDDQVGAPTIAEMVECCICLDLYEDGVELKELPCAHRFHVKCIDQWLTINGSCPICKKTVGKSSGASTIMELAFTTVTV